MKRYVALLLAAMIVFMGMGFALKPTRTTIMEVRLYLNNTNAVLHIPTKPASDIPASSITYTTFDKDDLSHLYIASYGNEMLVGMVFSSNNFIKAWINKSDNEYVIAMKLNVTDSQIFIPFTKGSWRTIDNRMGYIEAKKFLNEEKPSFYFGLGKEQEIMIYTQYDNINFTSNITSLGRGYHRIVVENMGSLGDKVWLHIRRV